MKTAKKLQTELDYLNTTITKCFDYLNIKGEKVSKGSRTLTYYSDKEIETLKDFLKDNPNPRKILTEFTNLQRYGVKNISQLNDIKDKKKETTKKNFGVENPLQSIEIKDKIKETNKEKYGTEWQTQSNNFKEKSKLKCQELYGVDFFCQTDIVKDKISSTCKEKYGVSTIGKLKSIHTKGKISLLERTKKDRDILLEKYGKVYSSKEMVILCERNESTLGLIKKKLNIENIVSTRGIVYNTENDLLKIKEYCKDTNSWGSSLGEKEVVEFVKSITSENIVENDRDILGGKELDIYIPTKNLAIEFNGIYWHNELNVPDDYHVSKTNICNEKNIRLLHFTDYEWNYKKEICKSIICSALNIYKEKIFARKCIIKEIVSKDYKNFLTENHIHGAVNSKYKYGLFYNNELVQVVGLGKSRYEKDIIELHRMVTKNNTQVIGGFSKLLKNVMEKENIREIISYIDKSLFTGIGYEKLGFKLVSSTKPNYRYEHKNQLYSRLDFQKHKLKDKLTIYDDNLTEHENMLNNKYYRIYDCGNYKVKLQKTT